jgi:predicted transcriptional regulator
VEKMPENPSCVNEDCHKDAKEFNERKSKSYVSGKICKYAHKLKLRYKFKNPLTFQQLRNYENQETGRP